MSSVCNAFGRICVELFNCFHSRDDQLLDRFDSEYSGSVREIHSGGQPCGSFHSDCADAVRERVQSRRGTSTDTLVDLTTLLLSSNPSRVLGQHYQIERQLGKGGYGTVFRAKHKLTGSKRAIKLLPKPQAAEKRHRLYTELELMTTLCHPNIVKMYEFFEDKYQLLLVMECYSGGDFFDLKGVETDGVILVFRDVFMAIAYCHDLGVAHRDLKFENCLICKEPGQRMVGKVIDFGLAAIRREGQGTEWLDEFLGSRFFVAPEIVDGAQTYGVKVDMWALGVMLYIFFADFTEHPCSENALHISTRELMKCIKQGHVRTEPLDTFDVDGPIRNLILGLLHKDPDTRLSAMEALENEWLHLPSEVNESECPAIKHSWSSDPGSFASEGTTCSSNASTIAARMQNFAHLSKFEHAVLTLLAHTVVAQEVDFIRSVFIELDTSQNGTLEIEEIGEGFRLAGKEVSEKQLHDIFESLDADSTGHVNYVEWISATMEPSLLTKADAILQIYAFFDTSQDGKVSRDELAQVIGDEDAVDDIFERAGSPGESYLSEVEFFALVVDIAKGIERFLAAKVT